MDKERVIGRYSGQENGPLFVCLGGIHGNEPAGVAAIYRFFQTLAAHPELPFRGTILGLKGNMAALEKGTRFVGRDLNRMMTANIVEAARQPPKENLNGELLELRELLDHVDREVARTQPEQLVVLDFHTTSADGGIFSIPAGNRGSRDLALHFHVPMINGMAEELDGTSLSYFTPEYRGIPCLAVGFEAGQNEDPLSELRSVAVIINALKAAGCIAREALPNEHEHLLLEYSEGLPPVSELVWIHHVRMGDGFTMKPGYRNFQPVREGEHLADDHKGPVLSPSDGMILMPLYQAQGSNGFFLVRAVTG